MRNVKLAVIGAGPGGYQAALLAAVSGVETLLIEKSYLGGVCLNWGCIPTKYFLNQSEKYLQIKESKNFGLGEGSLSLDYKSLKKEKDSLVESLRGGIKFLLDKRGVDLIFKEARILSSNRILIKDGDSSEEIEASNIIVATGSRPKPLLGIEFDNKRVFSSDTILDLDYIPKSITIIGAGAIGVEFASHFSRLGSEVILVEAMDSILPNVERELSKVVESSLVKQGVKIYSSSKVVDLKKREESLEFNLSSGNRLSSQIALIAISRDPNVEVLDNTGIDLKDKFVAVNSNTESSLKGLYAIGDLIGGPMLAHSASYGAHIAVSNIIGIKKELDYSYIPNCIYTDPEIAYVGLEEAEAKEQGFKVKIAKFSFNALGKARAISKREGFIKLIADENSKTILGAGLVGSSVTELITELTMAIKFKIPYSELIDVVHPHPTLSEVIGEALAILNDKAIHYI
ncbi:MAG: dihydrolipoyl dehydrogenase [Candidatus Kaelpia aquatica]|nr:dihydrolipoyl dehydrogenase [Candidatus Kaelpia aquatica]